MHGVIDKRGRKRAAAKPPGARRNGAAHRGPAARSPRIAADADAPLMLKVSPRLDRALTKLAAKSGKPKHYHVRRALERYVEDTWDVLLAEEALKSTRRTYSTAEVKVGHRKEIYR
jgi:predicted DNA-binding protein